MVCLGKVLGRNRSFERGARRFSKWSLLSSRKELASFCIDSPWDLLEVLLHSNSGSREFSLARSHCLLLSVLAYNCSLFVNPFKSLKCSQLSLFFALANLTCLCFPNNSSACILRHNQTFVLCCFFGDRYSPRGILGF